MKLAHIRESAGLLTPRKDIADRDPGLNRTELISSQRLRRIEAVYLGSEQTFADKVEAANEVGHMVRQTLLFGSMVKQGNQLWTEDAETDSMKTNCYGHTIVTSELLDALAIPHSISFANGHSFVTMFDEEGSYAHMIDAPSKDLFVELDSAVYGNWPATVLEDEGVKCVTNMLDTSKILAQVKRKQPYEMLQEHPWLTHAKLVHVDEEPTASGVYVVMMRTYRPKEGREMLRHYAMAFQYMHNGSLGSALDAFVQLEGYYPDVDKENRLQLASKLRERLAKAGLIDQMEDVARVVDESLAKDGPAEDRTSNQYFLLDTARRMAYLSGSDEALDDVAEGYLHVGRVTELAKGKQKRARNLAAQIRKQR